jgi:hypothetical protein
MAFKLTFVPAGGSAPAVYAAQTPPIAIAVPVAGIGVTMLGLRELDYTYLYLSCQTYRRSVPVMQYLVGAKANFLRMIVEIIKL